ncbi:hypothetical protein HDU97_002504 [Phlyctochytrium planicorne]|nr:hypothetical protein HDU97_002504 [Phlyctochytrium planicorne]
MTPSSARPTAPQRRDSGLPAPTTAYSSSPAPASSSSLPHPQKHLQLEPPKRESGASLPRPHRRAGPGTQPRSPVAKVNQDEGSSVGSISTASRTPPPRTATSAQVALPTASTSPSSSDTEKSARSPPPRSVTNLPAYSNQREGNTFGLRSDEKANNASVLLQEQQRQQQQQEWTATSSPTTNIQYQNQPQALPPSQQLHTSLPRPQIAPLTRATPTPNAPHRFGSGDDAFANYNSNIHQEQQPTQQDTPKKTWKIGKKSKEGVNLTAGKPSFTPQGTLNRGLVDPMDARRQADRNFYRTCIVSVVVTVIVVAGVMAPLLIFVILKKNPSDIPPQK